MKSIAAHILLVLLTISHLSAETDQSKANGRTEILPPKTE
jgi:hypothetical protein